MPNSLQLAPHFLCPAPYTLHPSPHVLFHRISRCPYGCTQPRGRREPEGRGRQCFFCGKQSKNPLSYIVCVSPGLMPSS